MAVNSSENGSSASNDQQAMGRWGLWSGYRINRSKAAPTRSVGAACSLLCLLSSTNRPDDAVPDPVRRPSGGAVERGVWHGCQTSHDGPGMALRDDPRSSTGAREVSRSETRMPGALSLWLLSLLREQRESDSP